MSAAAALHSDHINLLVFRYLQEIGFENAATAFHRDWHRPTEFSDPERYPFAPSIQRNELVSVIQTGLSYDELQARIRKQERRFQWTGVDPRDGVERQDRDIENGAVPRPSSSGRRKGRAPGARSLDEFANKRQRRSEGSEAHVNGDRDAMDIDNASGDAEAEGEGDVVSPTMQSEPEPMEEVQRYDSMDVATQTEIKAGPKTSTIYWKVDKPAANILHSVWNPDSDPKNMRTLLTVGDSICRFYQVPDSLEDAGQITHVDEPALPAGSTVTASAWRPDGSGASCAFNGMRELPDGTNVASQMLIEHHREMGTSCFQIEPQLLEPPGVVLCLRYSQNTSYLLVAVTNGQRGLVQIWETPSDSNSPKTQREPCAWKIFENTLLDVSWTGDDTFLACGAGGLSAMYQIDQNRQQEIGAVEAGTVSMRGLISQNSNVLEGSHDWDKVRWDDQHNLAVFVSSMEKRMVISSRLQNGSEGTGEEDLQIDLPEEPTALAFKPKHGQAEAEDPSLLAAAFVDGSCLVYRIDRSGDAGTKCNELVSLSLDDGPALAVAWSPNGQYLAVGNSELVQIWSADALKRQNGVRHPPQAAVIWRPAPEVNGTMNGHAQDENMPEPSLSWSADGESLAYAADKQIAVVRFRPALNADSSDNQPNGRLSP